MHEKSQMAFFASLLDSAEFLNFTLFYGAPKSLKISKKETESQMGFFEHVQIT